MTLVVSEVPVCRDLSHVVILEPVQLQILVPKGIDLFTPPHYFKCAFWITLLIYVFLESFTIEGRGWGMVRGVV